MVKQLQALVDNTTAGDPVTGMRWTHKSTRKLAAALRRLGFRIGATTVGRIIIGESTFEEIQRDDPERDRQFRYIARQRRRFQKQGNPAVSIDTKKKEQVGRFKNAGRTWRRAAIDVWDHDFPSLALGRGIPFGIYDGQQSTGFVVVGTSNETAAFAANAVSLWWEEHGRWCYPKSKHWFLQADCGGGNNPRVWAWRWELQQLANRWGVAITVAHYPPGASKWNPIEHRLFSHISLNWQGEPLQDYETMLNFIRHTTTGTGLRCRALLDTANYPTTVTITEEQKQEIRITRSKVLPQWNYTIYPQPKRPG